MAKVTSSTEVLVDPGPKIHHLPVVAPRREQDGEKLRITAETEALRQVRLKAVTRFMLAAQVAFLVWRLLFAEAELWPLNALAIATMAAALALLTSARDASPRTVRIFEIVIFGMMAVFLVIRQFYYMNRALTLGPSPVDPLILATKDALVGSIILLFAHAMLMPNPWQRSARFAVVVALLPFFTAAIFYSFHLDVLRAILSQTSRDFSENIVFSGMAMALAVYGTNVINTLRIEAFEARKLNQYKLGERLGSGGMGEVFHAEHRLLKRPCAIKLIRPDRARDPRALTRFEREVQATAKLSHPNTIEIFDYGLAEDGTFYYVMEFLPGLSLSQIVEKYGPLPPARVVYLLRQACEALAEAHAAGLIHRDIKPGNIFASKRGGRYDVAKLLDFGLVKGIEVPGSEVLSREGTVRGTPHFMAPEQAMADPTLDHRCDLYAMGGVAYCLLTGRPPFEGDSATRVMIGHARDPVEPPSHLRTEIPEDLERVVLKCLEKRRDDRYPDATSLAEALAACACASEWDYRRAAQWWRVVAPDL